MTAVPRRIPRNPDEPKVGERTRNQLLEASGEVFAARGRDGATSREICDRAAMNTAAVNYHFGGIDALYIETLLLAHRRLIGGDGLTAIVASNAEPRDKLRAFLAPVLRRLFEPVAKSWEVRLLAREIVAPTKAREALARIALDPMVQSLKTIVAELIDAAPDDPAVGRALLTVAAPVMMLAVASRPTIKTMVPAFGRNLENEALLDHIERFVLGGLDAVARELRPDPRELAPDSDRPFVVRRTQH